jgi:hypothetical protein
VFENKSDFLNNALDGATTRIISKEFFSSISWTSKKFSPLSGTFPEAPQNVVFALIQEDQFSSLEKRAGQED